MTTATLQNINEARETALNTMAADTAIASVWMKFASTCGPAIAKFDRAGGMHHATFLSRFPNEDAVNQWIESLEA